MQERRTILLVGCGRMGGAIGRSLAKANKVLAYDPNAQIPAGIELLESLNGDRLPNDLIIVVAVKPQVFASLAADIATLHQPGRIFVSIMAGITLDLLTAALPERAAIIRAMPNTPAAIGHGIAAAVAGRDVSDTQREVATYVLKSAGDLIWLEDEAKLDIVTAVSGSGPAYFYRFAEALAQAGEQHGLARKEAMQLARQTFIGAARLAETEGLTLAELREQVTSPGGTTAAGLAVMNEEQAIERLASDIVANASDRSRELAAKTD